MPVYVDIPDNILYADTPRELLDMAHQLQLDITDIQSTTYATYFHIDRQQRQRAIMRGAFERSFAEWRDGFKAHGPRLDADHGGK